MNAQIIPQGPTELVGPSTITREALVLSAVDALTLTNVVFCFQATPANAGAVSSCTLATGDSIFNVKSCNIAAGTACIIYRH